jgi:UDP-N-acetylmuramate--alanine ligase
MIIKNKKIHFIGIGGISMQGIAKTLHEAGNKVTGSDLKRNDEIEQLDKMGVKISIGHKASNVSKDINYVVISNAIPKENPELKKAKKLNIPVLTNAEMIQKILADKKLIAISGTHGKSTISAMASYILEKNNFRPTFYLGARSNQLSGGSAYYSNEGEWAVVEACEYKEAFLSYCPDIILISNIEAEHLDYFKDLESVKKAYLKFIGKLKIGGKLIVCKESPNAIEVAEKSGRDFLTYGFRDADYIVDQTLDLKVFGQHNYLNGLGAVLAVTIANKNLNFEEAQFALEKFQGIKRRSQYLGRKGSVLVYDDYGHHPTEVKTTLRAFKDEFNNKQIFLVFQPHQLDRLNSFYDDFVSSLVIADKIVILKTYQPPGRDKKHDRDSKDLVFSLKESGCKAFYAKNFYQAAQLIKNKSGVGDVVITMGAGPVYEAAKIYLKNDK